MNLLKKLIAMARPKKNSDKKETPAKKEKAVAAKVANPKDSKVISKEGKIQEPIVVESPAQPTPATEPRKERVSAPASSPNPANEISDSVKNTAKLIDKIIKQHRGKVTKAEVDSFIRQNSHIQIIAVYSKNGFCLDFYDMGKKMRMPSAGEYPLAV